MCKSRGPRVRPWVVCVSTGAGIRGRMHVPQCRPMREVCTLSCVQMGGTENTHVHVVCKHMGAGSAAGRRQSWNGTGLYVGPRGGFLRDEHPAPSGTCCPRHLAAQAILRGRCSSILGPLGELPLHLSQAIYLVKGRVEVEAKYPGIRVCFNCCSRPLFIWLANLFYIMVHINENFCSTLG